MNKLKGNYRSYRFNSLANLEAKESGEPNAFHNGYEDGFNEGVEKGLSQGLSEGRAQGLASGTEDGRKEGVAKGEEEGRELFIPAMKTLEAIQRELDESRKRSLSEYTDNICLLVEQVARRVIHAELTLNSGQMLKLIEDALSQMDSTKGEMTVYVSKDDHDRLSRTGTSKVGSYMILADPELSIGDCRVESDEQQMTVNSEERLKSCVENVRKEISE
jgi:flagellar assembly protein FliH